MQDDPAANHGRSTRAGQTAKELGRAVAVFDVVAGQANGRHNGEEYRHKPQQAFTVAEDGRIAQHQTVG